MRSAEVEHQSGLNRTPPPARRGYGNGLAAGGVGSMRADTIGGLALPLDLGRASRITRVEVDNLAMVDNVSIKVYADRRSVLLCNDGRCMPSTFEEVCLHLVCGTRGPDVELRRD